MEKSDILKSKALYEYILSTSLREHPVLRSLREETSNLPEAIMQIPPEQGQFMGLLVKMIGARKTLDLGTYTGYSALSVALSTEKESKTITCEVNETWAHMGERYWKKAGVADKIDLKMGPAMDTLNKLLDGGHKESFDFAFLDADKENYNDYYEKVLELMRPGGIMAIDNVFLFGSVVDRAFMDETFKDLISEEETQSIQSLNDKIKEDERVDLSMLPMADGLTLVRKK